jgi:hypothetical protein
LPRRDAKNHCGQDGRLSHGLNPVHSLLIALLLASAPATAEVSATRLDGGAVGGKLQSWNDKEAVLAVGEDELVIAIDELLSLRWGSFSPQPSTDGHSSTAQIELVDGSVIPIEAYESTGSEASLKVARSLPVDENTLALSKKHVAAVRLVALETTASEQWQEIRDLKLAGDVIVLLKRGGKSLDYVEGVLADVSSDNIQFKLDGEPVRIDREKLAGFVYYNREAGKQFEPRCVIHSRSGLRANISRANLRDDALHLTTACGVELEWPLADIYLADYAAGKLVYLSDLEPLSERWTPLIGLPAGATLAAEYGEPRRDQSAHGGPLTVASDRDLSSLPAERVKSFNKGVALRSRTEIVYRLPAGFRQMNAIAGIDPASSQNGNVRLTIIGDERSLLETDIDGNDGPRTIDLDIAGVKRLKIFVDYGRNLDTGDWLNLCDARIVK